MATIHIQPGPELYIFSLDRILLYDSDEFWEWVKKDVAKEGPGEWGGSAQGEGFETHWDDGDDTSDVVEGSAVYQRARAARVLRYDDYGRRVNEVGEGIAVESDPNQPRAPEGDPEGRGGQWIDADGGAVAAEVDSLKVPPEYARRFGYNSGRYFVGRRDATLAHHGMAEDEYNALIDAVGRRGDDREAAKERLAQLHAETETAGTEYVAGLLADKPIAIRTPEAAAVKIIKDGRFKSQFETRKSMGALDPSFRAEAEYAMFGYDRKMDKTQRPIYGYIHGLVEQQHHNLTGYGEVEWILKRDARARATVSLVDSLQQMQEYSGHPTPLNRVGPMSWIGTENSVDIVRRTFDPASVWYVEAQVHGGVRTSDIDRVILHGTSGANAKLIKALDSAGISYEVQQ